MLITILYIKRPSDNEKNTPKKKTTLKNVLVQLCSFTIAYLPIAALIPFKSTANDKNSWKCAEGITENDWFREMSWSRLLYSLVIFLNRSIFIPPWEHFCETPPSTKRYCWVTSPAPSSSSYSHSKVDTRQSRTTWALSHSYAINQNISFTSLTYWLVFPKASLVLCQTWVTHWAI